MSYFFENNEEMNETCAAPKDELYYIAGGLMDRYVTCRSKYVQMSSEKAYLAKNKATQEPLPLTYGVLRKHLEYQFSVAIFGGAKASKFVCFDVDYPDPEVVRRLIREIVAFGFPKDSVHVSTSGGKGYHVELFFDNVVYTNLLKDFYQYICEHGGFDPHKVEFRPTNSQAIKLPLGKHYKTGNICWFLDRDTLEPIQDNTYLLRIVPLERDWAQNLIRERCTSWKRKKRAVHKMNGPQKQGIETVRYEKRVPQMTGPGMRHNLMVSIATHERCNGKNQQEIEATLRSWLADQPQEYITDPPDEVAEDIVRIAAWTCRETFKAVRREVFLTQAEADMIVFQHCGLRKKLLYLIIMFCKWQGTAKMTPKTMRAYVGSSEAGVKKALKELRKTGVIKVEPGPVLMQEGNLYREPNTYTYQKPEQKEGKQMPIHWSYRADSFLDEYRKAIRFFVPEGEWQGLFTKKELEELRKETS